MRYTGCFVHLIGVHKAIKYTNKLKIYGLSGLGVDERIFKYLTLECQLIPIPWIKPIKGESLVSYSKRLAENINQDEEFGILGVSFGGLVAVEISKLLQPSLTVLISSAETRNDLRPIYNTLAKTGIAKIFPEKLFDPPKGIVQFLFGTKDKLLNQILDDADLSFTKWAVNAMLGWDNEQRIKGAIKISGSKDKLLPPSLKDDVHIIEGGEHFMIVDKAEEVSDIINQDLRGHH